MSGVPLIVFWYILSTDNQNQDPGPNLMNITFRDNRCEVFAFFRVADDDPGPLALLQYKPSLDHRGSIQAASSHGIGGMGYYYLINRTIMIVSIKSIHDCQSN